MKKVFCSTCGGAQEVDESKKEFVCEYCGLTQCLEREIDPKLSSLLNRANDIRHHCEFDKAIKSYEAVLNIDPTIAEANFGLFLCNYGVEYVDDPKTGKKIPTCHRTNSVSVSKDSNYIAALNNADELTKKHYEEEGNKIEELQKNITKVLKTEKPYDVFISYKETDKKGERTEDSSLAFNIYNALTEKGYRTFYSRETLKGKLGVEYEPYIYNALSTAKVLIILGTSKENMESVWVKNEWSRFIKMAEKDNTKVIIPCYKDFEAYDLPDELVNYQAADMSDVAFNNELVHNIEKLFDKFDDDKVEEVKEARRVEKSNKVLAEEKIAAIEDFVRSGDIAEAKVVINEMRSNNLTHPRLNLYKYIIVSRLKSFKDVCESIVANAGFQSASYEFHYDSFVQEPFDDLVEDMSKNQEAFTKKEIDMFKDALIDLGDKYIAKLKRYGFLTYDEAYQCAKAIVSAGKILGDESFVLDYAHDILGFIQNKLSQNYVLYHYFGRIVANEEGDKNFNVKDYRCASKFMIDKFLSHDAQTGYNWDSQNNAKFIKEMYSEEEYKEYCEYACEEYADVVAKIIKSDLSRKLGQTRDDLYYYINYYNDIIDKHKYVRNSSNSANIKELMNFIVKAARATRFDYLEYPPDGYEDVSEIDLYSYLSVNEGDSDYLSKFKNRHFAKLVEAKKADIEYKNSDEYKKKVKSEQKKEESKEIIKKVIKITIKVVIALAIIYGVLAIIAITEGLSGPFWDALFPWVDKIIG